MGEAKRRKAIDDLYGMGQLPEAARPFVLAMQESVEHHARNLGSENNRRCDHQLFFDGVLQGESGVYAVGVPVDLFDLGEYALTASLLALTGFMGVSRFGMVMQSYDVKKKPVPAAQDAERTSVIMMLACINGAWFYNMFNLDPSDTASMTGISDWHQGKVKDLALSDHASSFMTSMADVLKKSRALQDNTKAAMTLAYLKDHYRVRVSAPIQASAIGDASIN